ncbi:hypothetical protein ACQJBY_018825 [Aegilops geniculata]
MDPGVAARSAVEGTTSTTAPLPCILNAPNPGHLDDSASSRTTCTTVLLPQNRRCRRLSATSPTPVERHRSHRLQHQIRSLCPEVGWGLSTWQVSLDVSKIEMSGFGVIPLMVWHCTDKL